jgi:hypothetical protein
VPKRRIHENHRQMLSFSSLAAYLLKIPEIN